VGEPRLLPRSSVPSLLGGCVRNTGDDGREFTGDMVVGDSGIIAGVGDATLDVGNDSRSLSSVLSLSPFSPFFLYWTVVLDGDVILMVTVSPIECWESEGLCASGVSVSRMFSRSPTDTLLVSGITITIVITDYNTLWYSTDSSLSLYVHVSQKLQTKVVGYNTVLLQHCLLCELQLQHYRA
jgi:hypothetical protein